MNLIARSTERAPSALSSIASESPGKTRHESQSPLSPQAEKYDRTVRDSFFCSERAHRPVVFAHSSSYSDWNVDKTWSSQEGKSDELMDDRKERPVVALSERISSLLKTTKQNQNCRQDPDHFCTG